MAEDFEGWIPVARPGEVDHELATVAAEIRRLDPDGSRTARALRRTLDMLLDGQNTGRFRWGQLHKTEKTHCGTLVEINMQREFKFAGGDDLDYKIVGIDVDCKFSQDMWKWMIPPEAVGKLCLVVWANDESSLWWSGLVRTIDSVLTGGANRDQKRTLSKDGRNAVLPLFWNQPLQDNVLLRLPQRDIDAIFAPKHGTKRVDMLFRLAQRRLISRTAVATVAQQNDYMKRIRYNGGARAHLRPEGIVIFGQYGVHQAAAAALGLPVPGPGESVSARLARYSPARHGVAAERTFLADDWWVLANGADSAELAPLLPEPKESSGDRE